MIIQVVKLKTELSEAEVLKIAKERQAQFQAIPGLIQKYYVKTGQGGQFAGVYVWDSKESLKAYRESDLAVSIPKVYQLIEAPDIEIMDVLFQLRS